MKSQDYLHYYLGAKCTVVRNDKQEYEDIVCLGLLSDLQRSEYKRSDHLSTARPHLRRLEDMTEEEAISVHREATKTPFLPADKNEYDVTYIKDKGEVCSIQVVDLRMPKMYTNINIEGDVLVYIHEANENPKICERVANQHQITHYLLTKHFDLFNLIDAGFAIDTKTITHE